MDSPSGSPIESGRPPDGNRRRAAAAAGRRTPACRRSTAAGEAPASNPMSGNRTDGVLRRDQARVTAAEWFAGGQRTWYDPIAARVLAEDEAAATPHALRVFERVAAAEHDTGGVWLTLLPGFPD